jgi:hypothetical protein
LAEKAEAEVSVNKPLLTQCACMALKKLALVNQFWGDDGTLGEPLARRSVGEFYFWLSLGLGQCPSRRLPARMTDVDPQDLASPIQLPRTGYVHQSDPRLAKLMEQHTDDSGWNEFSTRLTLSKIGMAIESLAECLMALTSGRRGDSRDVQEALGYAIGNVNHAWNFRFLTAMPDSDEWEVYRSAPTDFSAPQTLADLQAREQSADLVKENALAKLKLRLAPGDYRLIVSEEKRDCE